MLIDAPRYVFALWQPLAMSQQKENISVIVVGLNIAESIISKLSTLNMPVQLSWQSTKLLILGSRVRVPAGAPGQLLTGRISSIMNYESKNYGKNRLACANRCSVDGSPQKVMRTKRGSSPLVSTIWQRSEVATQGSAKAQSLVRIQLATPLNSACF